MPITHAFVSAVPDGEDTSLVRPSNWNANHTYHGWRDELQNLIGQKLESPSSDIVQNIAEGTLTYKKTCTLSDYCIMNIQINHDWQEGTAFKPHLHWFQAAAAIPNWLIQYRWQVNGGIKVTDWTSQKWNAHAFTYLTGTLNQLTMFGSISVASYNISDILQVRVLRDSANASTKFTGADPLNASAEAINFDIHLEVNSPGSTEEYVK